MTKFEMQQNRDTMKRVTLLAVFSLVAVFALAQSSAVNKAETFRKDGKLAEAKPLVDQAIEHEKTKDKGKTWYVRGQVYEDIATSADPAVTSIDSDAANKAIEAYAKVQNMEKEGSTYYSFAQIRIDNMWAAFLNAGASKYGEGDYESAINNFLICQKVKPMDTTAYLYAGAAAQSAEKYDLALESYYKLVELGSKKADVYGSLIALEKLHNRDTAKAMALVQEALEHNPGNDGLKREEINLLIMTNKLEDAKAKLLATIEDDPDNHQLYYSLAYMYDETGDDDNAVKSYEQALGIKPDFFEANFNLAVLLYNKGAEKYKEANNLSIQEYQKKGADIEAEGKEWLAKSLPYWEAAYGAKQDDLATISNLQSVYVRLKMNDKAEEMAKRAEELGGMPDN